VKADTDFDALEKRIGRLHLAQRMSIQVNHVAQIFSQGLGHFHVENLYGLFLLLRFGLRLSGLYKRGQRNCLDVRTRHNRVHIPGLPEEFEGFRLLHFSDLHIDIHPKLPEVLSARAREEEYDLCVMTGDFRSRTYGPFDQVLEGMSTLSANLKTPAYGILGNHDFIEMASGFESMGIRMLLNENAKIERNGKAIYLAGIDDPYYYMVDNLEKAAQGIPPDAVSILLSHTPEPYRKAAFCDFDLLLCGHTHAGQICLPGGIPLLLNAKCPRSYCRGAWRYRELQGYTSSGSGSSGVDVRFNCPPEVTIHELVG
jgi:uncharacterized protein